ncbi:acetylcholine receptor subunit beta-type unc-29-like [Convolutriloba macropyga]|uniref:acetylcholine receptor subunit beta-type unc-29-like n=1 Tax=Convolutriloba macropyga TaxID=536237 RepID=UPI003F52807C
MWPMLMICFLSCVALVAVVSADFQTSGHRHYSILPTGKRLERDLFANYRRFVKPREDQSRPVKVFYSSNVYQILGVEIETQRIKLNLWMHLLWKDNFMRWNFSQYDNLKEISVNPVKLWMPDIVIANRQDNEPTLRDTNQILVAINYKGEVSYLRPLVVTVQCTMDTRHFPWDSQTCRLIVASWTNFEDNVMLKNHKGANLDLINQTKHHEWTLEPESPLFRTVEVYDYIGNRLRNKSYIVHQINFTRKPNFYLIVIVMPTIVMSFVSVFVFLLPNGSSERITYSMSMLLTFYLNLLTVANNIPNNSLHYPYIGVYYILCIFLIASSLLQSTISLNMHHKTVECVRAPLWLRRATQGLCFSLMNRVNWARELFPMELISLMHSQHISTLKPTPVKLNLRYDSNGNEVSKVERVVLDCFMRFDALRHEFDKSNDKKRNLIQAVAEWQLMAKLVDIMLGLVYITITVTVNVFIILKAGRFI